MSRLARTVVRLPPTERRQLDALLRQYGGGTGRSVSRADLVRALLVRGLASLDEARPIPEQITRREMADRRPRAAPRAPQGNEPSLRQRILTAMEARPGAVFQPRHLAAFLDASTDTIRNALLVLAGRQRIEKVGEGRYRARVAQAPEMAA